MFYLVISRKCPEMQRELATALQGRRDIQVILDRRFGERRVTRQPVATDRRRADRRRTQDLILRD